MSMSRPSTVLVVALACLSIPACSRPRHEPTTRPSNEPIDMAYSEVDHQQLHAYVFDTQSNATSRAAILLFHGGGWSEGSPEWMFDAARRFAGTGMVAIPIEYRLARATVTPIESLSDVCAAFRWTREHAGRLRIDPNRVA